MEYDDSEAGPQTQNREMQAGDGASSSTSSFPLPAETMDSNGSSLQPGQFYLSIGYEDAETGFATHYIPISSTDFNNIVINDQELGNIYFNEETEEHSRIAEHTYHTYSTTETTAVPVFQSSSGTTFDVNSGNTSTNSANTYFSHTKERTAKWAKKTKRPKSKKDETKLWDSNRTLTLLQLMREHELNFKQHVSRQRVEVWESVAEEMRKLGYDDATKLTSAKKWYNVRKKYLELSGRGEKNWYCYKQVKYLIPVMRIRKELPFTQKLPFSSKSKSGTRKESLKFVKAFEDALAAQKQELLDKLEAFRAEKEVLNQEQELYLEEIRKSLQERSKRLKYRESVSAQHISPSSPTTLIATSNENEIRTLLPTEVEMVELVDGENIITTTSTDGEQIQLTVCLDWDQVSL